MIKSTLENDVKFLDQQYRTGNALISDAAFDQLERNLLRTHPDCNYFINSRKFKLPSLKKKNYKKFLDSLLKNTRLCIEPKIDGCAIAIQYKNGEFNKAITHTGKVVTSKIRKIQNIPSNIPIKRIFQVRGELYRPNVAATISQRSSSKYIKDLNTNFKDLSFCCFQILNGRLNQYETLNYLKKCGFITPHSYFTNFTSQVESYRQSWLEGKIFSNYPTDGIVIKINSRKLQLIREKSHFEYRDWQYAIKI